MAEYTVVYAKKGTDSKKGETDTVFAPSANDAWQMARQMLPKTTKIIDVIRASDYSNGSTYSNF